MKRRQFIKGIAAIAAVIASPFKKPEEFHVEWWDRHFQPLFSERYGYSPAMEMHIPASGTITGRLHAAGIDFEEIEKRVAAQMIRDGKHHHYGYNSNGEVFVDGKEV